MRKILMAAAAASAMSLAGFASAATVIQFDPDGAGSDTTKTIGSFTFAPGSSLAQGALPSAGVKGYNQYYQARVSGFQDGANNPIGGTNLNSTYELTAVVYTPAVAITTGNSVTLVGGGAASSFIELYYDTSSDADNLAGTGFNNGIKILSAEVSVFSGDVTILSPGTNPALDQFGSNDWLGVNSVRSLGSFDVTGIVTYFDSNFFKDTVPNQLQLAFSNGNTALPFQQTNPSRLFDGIENAGTGSGAAPTVVATPGALNGVDGPDILLQTTGTASFSTVPTPAASLGGLSLLGLLGAGKVIRRRSTSR